MKVAFVLEQARIDGTVRFVERQVRLLRGRGHAVQIACADGALAGALRAAGAHVEFFEALARGTDVFAARFRDERRRFARFVRDCELIVAAAGAAFPFAVAANAGPPLFLDVLANDLFVGEREETVRALHEAAAARRLVAHTIEDARAFGAPYGLTAGDFRFIALPVDRPPAAAADHLRAELARPGETLILTAARLDDDHVAYIRPLVRAVGRLRALGRLLRLTVVGGGAHERALRSEAPPFVNFLGFRRDLDALYALADAYVGEGSSRLEAALAGVPVVSSCAQTNPEIADRALLLYGMQQGTLASYAPNTIVAPVAFEAALALLLDDADLSRRVAARGRLRAETVHAPQRYVEWFEHLLAAPPPEPAPFVRERIEVDGADLPELRAAASRARAEGAVAISARNPVAWRTYASVHERDWDALADASRRAALDQSSSTASPTPVCP